jgi:hypothetical protein
VLLRGGRRRGGQVVGRGRVELVVRLVDDVVGVSFDRPLEPI